MMKSWNFFKNSKMNHDYAPDKKLRRGNFTQQQKYHTVKRIKNDQSSLFKKRLAIWSITITILIIGMYLINERVFF